MLAVRKKISRIYASISRTFNAINVKSSSLARAKISQQSTVAKTKPISIVAIATPPSSQLRLLADVKYVEER